MFSFVNIWLQDWSPDFAAFMHALEWAIRLRLPIRAVRVKNGLGSGQPRKIASSLASCDPWPPVRLPDLNRGFTPDIFSEICGLNNVELHVEEKGTPDLDRGLNVVSAYLPAKLRESLITRAIREQAGLLLCSAEWKSVQRPMLLNDSQRQDQSFFHMAAEICSLFQVTPIVLTIGPTESDAHRGQQFARHTMADEGQVAQYDYAAHCDLNSVVELEAHCRRSAHLFVSNHTASSKRRWPRNEPVLPVLTLSRFLTVLVLRESRRPAGVSLRVGAHADNDSSEREGQVKLDAGRLQRLDHGD